MDIPFIILCAGVLSGILIFFKRPVLTDYSNLTTTKKISVIIPARNEAKNLPGVLSDLLKQESDLFEIICIDDASTDNTAEVVNSFGVKLISVKDKPDGWTGKSFACQTGANDATGDLFLFIDADVRLDTKAVRKLAKEYETNNCVISVQPYHKVYKFYEHLSLFFNLVLIAANGVGLPFRKNNIGLFGPVILIGREEYFSVGGHSSVKKSIVDDLTLGENLKRSGLRFKLFLGGDDITFRMYSGGIRQLQQGWTKNITTGAAKTSFTLLIMITLWFAACTTGVLNFFELIVDYSSFKLVFSVLLYIIMVAELWAAARKIGSFKLIAIIFYPVELLTFFLIFLYSLIKKIFHIKVSWKGRKI